jgi:energy-converting hydrogenase A subunit M
MGDYLRNRRKRSQCDFRELDDSCFDLGSTHIDASYDFEIVVAQTDNDLNLAELQDVGELEEVELPDLCRDEGSITMLANSHGYTLCDGH